MGSHITFGANNRRGKTAEEYTFGNVRRCARGFADYLKSTYKPEQLKQSVVIGGDRRFMSKLNVT